MNSIRFYREKTGLTQAEFAAACGFSGQSVVSNYENGFREPGMKEIRAIQGALRKNGIRCSIDQLMSTQKAVA